MARGKKDRPAKTVLYRLEEAAAAIGVGKTKMRDLINAGVVAHVLVAGCIRVPEEALRRLDPGNTKPAK